ncbi:related to stress responsive A/B barrel domain protein [Phialocephala subalpina]|uniref:Related to stress responsive A/B barrel domain protein n=1 Tax=Phialocephala subalpina TaxID=576137 RepID=A0A1L7WQR4_9HELO|nr:related to stress responsive A/B barrel domain protein [Phialocephala subalpina]
MATEINRVTLFVVPKEEDRITVLAEFKKLQKSALKDGRPYITSVTAGEVLEGSRSQGYNLVLQTRFASLEDMNFFDTECEFHTEMKKVVGPRMVPPPVVVYFRSVI